MKFKKYLTEDKFDKILKNEKDLIKKYNIISKKSLKKGSLLQDLSDKEFFIWLVGKTYKYGRSFEDSVENAKIHMANREKAEKLFGTKKSDLLGFNG